MKLIGLLSFYDESPVWLHECITSHANSGVEHLVAVDGAYELLELGKGASPIEQHEAIIAATSDAGIGLTLPRASRTVAGERGREAHLHVPLGPAHLRGAQGLVVGDRRGPGRRDKIPGNVRDWLEQTECDAAEVTFWEPESPDLERDRDACFLVRSLFRAIPGLRCEGNHYTYVTPDGRRLWGNSTLKPIEPALPLHGVVIEHRTKWRTADRHEQQYAYYRARHSEGVGARPV